MKTRLTAALLTALAVLLMALPVAAENRPGVEVVVIDGADRYATAAQLALSTGDYASTLYIANGETLVDAMGAGAASGAHDKMLLVKRDSIPPATADALRQINYDRLVFLGGDDVISETVRNRVISSDLTCYGDCF